MSTPSALVSKLWNYCNILRDDGLSYGDYVEDESLEESANLPAPGVIAAEIAEDLEAALQQFATIAED